MLRVSLVFLSLLGVAAAQELPFANIDPEGIVLGVPLGATEPETIAKIGEPNARFTFDPKRSGLLYGRTFLLLFLEGKLDALRMGPDALGMLTRDLTPERPPFTKSSWRMTNGIFPEISLEKAQAILNQTPSAEAARVVWRGPNTILELDFQPYKMPDESKAYSLNGFLLATKTGNSHNWVASAPYAYRAVMKSSSNQSELGFEFEVVKEGIRCLKVSKNGAAARAGIKEGEIITSVDGWPTEGMSPRDFENRMWQAAPHMLRVVSADGTARLVKTSTLRQVVRRVKSNQN